MSQDKPKILLVDDDPNLLAVMRRIFEKMNCEVLLANNGAEAMKVVESERLSLIISDVRMPKMSGVELLEAVNAKGFDVPVIIMSGHSDYTALDIDERDGVVLMEKGFNTKQLQAIVEDYLFFLPEHDPKAQSS